MYMYILYDYVVCYVHDCNGGYCMYYTAIYIYTHYNVHQHATPSHTMHLYIYYTHILHYTPGILPQILDELLAARKRAKRDMAIATDPMEKAVQNGRQLG